MNTYAEPASEPLSLSRRAPITTVSASKSTEKPNWSPAAPSSARSFACWLHSPSSSRMNTYAEPESEPLSLSKRAPITAVSPETEAEKPNSSPAAPSLARSLSTSVSVGVCAQLDAPLRNNPSPSRTPGRSRKFTKNLASTIVSPDQKWSPGPQQGLRNQAYGD